MPKYSPLHKLTAAFWNTFYTGMTRVGLHPKDKPAFRATNDTEAETMRCMRHAVERLKDLPVEAFEREGMEAFGQSSEGLKRAFDAALVILFPEPLTQRKVKLTGNDKVIKDRAGARFG